jgi:glucose-6-phosphate isomerase
MMLNKINPLETKTWKILQDHYAVMKKQHMRDLFSEDPERFSRFSVRFEDILLDYSKNIITDKTMELLM